MSDIKIIKRRTKFFVWLMFFIPVSIFQGSAQTHFFNNYGIKQGLSSQKVYTLFQDSKDFIWLGTENGVSRFDGKKFENFTSRDSLAQGGVKCILEDSLGYIWFGHLNGGISRYNGRTFQRAAFDSLKVTWDITSISQIKNKLWVTSAKDGAILVDLPVSDIRKVRAKQFMGRDGLSDQVYGSTINRDGSFVCVTDVGLRKFIQNENRFEAYRMPHMTMYFFTSCLFEDSKGNLWFGTQNGGLYKYIMSESRMVFYDLIKEGFSSNWVSCLTEDSHGRIWVGTWGGGIVIFDGDMMQKFDITNGLNASKIYDIMEDAEDNILIADQDNGLTIFKGDAFATLVDKDLLPDQNVNAIMQDKTGSIWCGTNAGILRYFPGSDKHVIYNNRNSLIYNDIRFFREDRDGNIWIGTNGGGVIMFNMKKSQFEPQTDINDILFPEVNQVKQVKALEIDRQNNLWIGTADGVAMGKINEKNFWKYSIKDGLTGNLITALYCDPNGDMWVGIEPTSDKPGLIKYDATKNDFVKIMAFAGIIPRAIVMDRKGALWIGTDEKLLAFRNDSIFSTVTQDDGLLSNDINLLAVGKDGSIYIGTNIGLNRYFPESKRIYSFTENNGFTGMETKSNAVYESSSGDLWFGTANGVTQLTPDKIATRELEPLTHIMRMSVNSEIRDLLPGMRLKYNERPISFDFYSICLTNPDVVRYKVKLEGADNDWRSVSETRENFSVLPPGKYTFMVKASNSQGLWNSKPVTFSFIIKPPFYLTWWFILIVVIILVIIVVIYIKIREQSLINEKIILEEKVKERTAEVVQKSVEIEEKNRDITASIRYAERIQRAMLPREDTFHDTFVLFMPKDIVSGDFYWMYDNGDHQFIAVCDCTGHGVPGAFMSIIGHNSLNKIVREYGITRPSAILDQLNNEVLKALRQRNEETINDGMDMALISYDKKKLTLDFAGAYNPLYVVRKGEVFVYRGDRFPIGMTAISDKKSFSNQNVDIKPGDMVYMCSDGYADQFGSPEGKKFKSGKVKKLLSEICDLPICDQRTRLQQEILDWKGNLQQVDDIMFIGSRIPAN
jgi:ligand-binding sensor domain-containing protein/serine phosphatase RsbU (regulator of sigma subunit)